ATVPSGARLATIGQPDEQVADAAPPAAAEHHAPVSESMAEQVAEQMPQAEPVRAEERTVRDGMPHVTPVVARMAAEHNIDVRQVRGTGRGGRVTKKDILAYLESGAPQTAEADLPPWEQPGSGDLFKPTDDLYKKPAASAEPALPAPADHTHKAPPAPGKSGELVPLSTMRRRIAEHMVRSKLQTAPHVTTVFEADLHRVVQHRTAHKADFAARGVNLTFTAYFAAATAEALRRHPMVNSEWTDEGILLKPEINLGIATALDEGLIVPVVKRADELSLIGLARQINDLAGRARQNALQPDEVQGGTLSITNHGVAGSLPQPEMNLGIATALDEGLLVPVVKRADELSLIGLARQINDLAGRARQNALQPDEVQGGTFTITHHGVAGSLFATPIINQPQTGILGVGAIQKRVVVLENDAIAVRPMVYLTLTFDHRDRKSTRL